MSRRGIATPSGTSVGRELRFAGAPIEDSVFTTNIAAERIVLGSLLAGNNDQQVILGTLEADDFSDGGNRIIYQVLQQILPSAEVTDLVSTHAKTLASLPCGIPFGYLAVLRRDFSTKTDVSVYVQDLRIKSALRRLHKTIVGTASQIRSKTPPDVNLLVRDVGSQLSDISETYNCSANQPTTIQNTLDIIVEDLKAKQQSPNTPTGILTGFPKLDGITLGFQGGDLIVIAGRPSMGKTAFAMNIVSQVVLSGQASAAVFSLEMSCYQLLTRMISSVSEVELHKLRTGELSGADWEALAKAVVTIGTSELLVDDSSNLTPYDIRSKILSWCAAGEHKPGLIVIDYLQLMNSGSTSENRAAEVASITRSLKKLAKELNVPVVVISQLNRGLEQRSSKKPVLSDLKESGSIEQDADLILFVYRAEVYSANQKTKGKAEIIIGKHRNGPTGSIRLDYLGEYTKFLAN